MPSKGDFQTLIPPELYPETADEKRLDLLGWWCAVRFILEILRNCWPTDFHRLSLHAGPPMA